MQEPSSSNQSVVRARLAAIVESSDDAIVAKTLEGIITDWNLGAQRIFGYTSDEIVGKPITTLIPPDRQHEETMILDRLRRGERIEHFQTVRRTKDGRLIDVSVTISPIRGPDGRIIGASKIARDVTDEKRAAEELQRRRQQMELVVHGASVGVWYCPLPFDRLIWDEQVKAHFHLAPDAEVTIDTFYARLHPEDRDRTRASIETSIAHREPYDIDYRTVSEDGTKTKWIRASGRGFYDESGKPVRFDGITIDITERVRVEQRLREETDAVETINRIGRTIAGELNLSQLVQVVTDETTRLSGAEFGAFFYNVINERGESYSLYSLSGVDRSHFDKFPMPRNTKIFAPTFGGEGVVRLDDVTADARYGQNPPYHGMPKGHLPVRSYLAVPVISRSGEVLGGLFFGHSKVGVFTDRAEKIVAGIAAQAAVAIDNARLFDSARRANAEKDQLLESERAARAEVERSSRMKDEFLATLSHELRTPLNAILGWAQLLRTAQGQDEITEGAQIIERNARVQTQIIEDLLDMSRITSGKIRLDVQRVDIGAVVQSAVDTVRATASTKGIRLQIVLDPLAGPVAGDPNRLQQVFWNLLTNAIKFTPKGGRVQVLLERVNSHIEVSVIDSGEGIAPEFLPYVFDRFRQADASTTRRHGGLGLGLAIVKQLIELHGGTVRVKSAGVGAGSTFTVMLPLTAIHSEPARDPERQHPKVASSVPLLPDTCVEIEGLRVLVVDDEPDARALVKRFLEECKAVVTVAGSASEALKRIKADPPDVLISDIGMPEQDGIALIRDIRALGAENGGQVPAVALTAYARAEDRMKAMLAGFDQHLVKPVEPAELITVVAVLAKRVKR